MIHAKMLNYEEEEITNLARQEVLEVVCRDIRNMNKLGQNYHWPNIKKLKLNDTEIRVLLNYGYTIEKYNSKIRISW